MSSNDENNNAGRGIGIGGGAFVPAWRVPGSVIMRPITEGWKSFQEGLGFGENRRRTPDKPKSHVEPEREDIQQLANKRGWELPVNFCADCCKNDLSLEEDEYDRRKAGATVYLIEEHEGYREDLQLRPGDFIVGYFCFPCTQAKAPVKLYLPHYDEDDEITDMDEDDDGPDVWSTARRKRRWANIQEWVRLARLRGEEPGEFNGEGVCVRKQGAPDAPST